MFAEFWIILVALFLGVAGYFLYFWKINWIEDLTTGKDSRFTNAIVGSRKHGKLPPVYPNGWYALVESSSLKAKQVKHVVALGQNFAVFRTEKGKVRILDAYCPHLGANMAEDGKVIGENLECPFHSWQFCGRSGQCTKIPYSKSLPRGFNVNTWACCEKNGFIFVWYHVESFEPNWWPEQIEQIANRNWVYQGRNEFYINCHIQEIPENGADWAHLNAVHGPMMFLNKVIPGIARHSWTNALWWPNTNPPAGHEGTSKSTEKHRATVLLKHQLVLFERFSMITLDVKVDQIGPAYVELLLDTYFGPLCVLQTIVPLGPLLQKVTHVMYSPRLMSPYTMLVTLGECIMFQRDVAIWNKKTFLKTPLLVEEDRNIKAFRKWYSQFYSNNSLTYQDACSRSLEW